MKKAISLSNSAMCACEKGQSASPSIYPWGGFAGKCQVAADESSGELTQNYMNKQAGASLRLFPVVPTKFKDFYYWVKDLRKVE